MAKDIKKVAVIGSGVMGSAIAAHIANAGYPVLLLDIVPKDGGDRNALAKGAIERLKKTKPAPFTHKSKVKLVTPGNLEDDLALLREVDWIIEAIIEDAQIKKNLYRKINGYRHEGCIVSSNTSTIPLHELIEGMPNEFRRDFLITHFFNPPRYMRLLELVTGPETRERWGERIRNFCDVHLGKGVVNCKDTPGFIANRIGCFWMTVGLDAAIKQGVSVEVADAVMGKPVGIPKTGVFGLMDLIGIDLLPLIAKEMMSTLPKEDRFCKMYKLPDTVDKMIKDGYTGRKGKGGFYRLNEDGGKKTKESVDLKTGKYSTSEKPKLDSVNAAREGLRKLLTHQDAGGRYALEVMAETLGYTASLVPEISDSIADVDEAMRLGYNWKYGPFELIDRMGEDGESGPKWFAAKLQEMGKEVPQVLTDIGDGNFYKIEEGARKYFDVANKAYVEIKVPEDAWTLNDIKLKSKPITKNHSAALWDVGDGVVCLEFISKMNSLDPLVLEMIIKSVEIVKKDYRAMIIANDGDNFSVGANIGVLLFAANLAAWKMIDGIIKQGQDAVMALKYAPFPVVGAPSGMALGGGCEILLHCDAIQAHIETYTGLVEVGVGLVPGWGGCKEMLLRQLDVRKKDQAALAKAGRMFSFLSPVKTANAMPAVAKAFEYISMAKVSTSAEEAVEMQILAPDRFGISMNRSRVMADAKKLALSLAEGYQPPEKMVCSLPGKTAQAALNMAVNNFVKSGKATKHDEVVSKSVGKVLSGGKTDITKEMTEQEILDLEREVFMELVKHPDSIARIEHMLETGKPLRN